ncbi:hypothetical protein KAW64_06405 [bacterium]|nr:hypothetical protein [bacterium]
MASTFAHTTAEHIVASVEALQTKGKPGDADFVSGFADVLDTQAANALQMAAALSLLASQSGGQFSVASPLCRVMATGSGVQRAAALRVALEWYAPYRIFKERLLETGNAGQAAKQTHALLSLGAHHGEIKDTLLSLGTYTQSLRELGGGKYEAGEHALHNELVALADACSTLAAAETRCREQIGVSFEGRLSYENTLQPLADALVKASRDDGAGAVQQAGNAVESFLDDLGSRSGANLGGVHGINGKIEELKKNNLIPTKLVFIGKFLGHIRNAADHGTDQDVGAPWNIRPATGTEYVFIACSFLSSLLRREDGEPPSL